VSKSIVFTGGGSGGHSVVAFAIINHLKSQGINEISYIGSHTGIEKDMARGEEVKYYSISTGKLRRYFSIDNFVDIFKFLFGILQSFYLFLTKLRNTDIVFSTGGFVSVPAAIAGRLLGKKVYLHEQTSRLGLANKIISMFAHKVFVSFESTKSLIKKECIVSGLPIRESLTNMTETIVTTKPLLFVTGGGNGSALINSLIDSYKHELLEKFVIYHQVGKKFLNDYNESEDYKVFGFINDELPAILNSASLIISRAGAGTVCEMMYLGKKTIFIPLKIAQQNEQYHNAMAAKKNGNALVVTEDELDCINFMDIVEKAILLNDKSVSRLNNACEIIFREILN